MPKIDSHFISLIVPVYKQERTIVKNLKHILSVLEDLRYDFELITVVDGEIDDSKKKIKQAKLKNTICLSYKENKGKSFAIREGMKIAHGDYIMFLDAGNEIDPNGISMLLEHMEWYNADIIVGSKRHPVSFVQYSPLRRVLSLGYYWMVKILFGINVRDTQAGIKVFRKKVLEKILPKLVEKKFAGDLEILVVAKIYGYNRIYEAPIKLDYSLASVTSAATLKSIWGMFVDTLAIYYRAYIIRYYKKSSLR